MITTQQTALLKKELQAMELRLAETSKETEITNAAQEEVGELSMYDNHPADMGTELYEREKDLALHTHAESELEKVKRALRAIQEGTYGICEQCGMDIQFDRLDAIPYTTLCIEDAQKSLPEEHQVTKDDLLMAEPNSFAKRREGAAKDYEDSFEEIAKSGTSETPSDFIGHGKRDYDNLYDVKKEDI